jgi:hypothetical protein
MSIHNEPCHFDRLPKKQADTPLTTGAKADSLFDL